MRDPLSFLSMILYSAQKPFIWNKAASLISLFVTLPFECSFLPLVAFEVPGAVKDGMNTSDLAAQ